VSRVLVTPPVEEPLTVDEVKLHLRIEEDVEDEDGLVDALIKAARVHVENETGRALLTQTWRYTLDDRFPYQRGYYGFRDAPFVLIPSPVQSVSYVKYYNTGGILTTLPTSDYYVDIASDPGRIVVPYGLTWPGTLYPRPAAVEVEYIAGYANPSLIPPTLKAAMKLIIGHLYENREGSVVGTTAMEVPLGVKSLLDPHRMLAVA
jgi:uncharacterized phiE125 gp8 family phage protein